jgi:hypothetical protein
MTPAEHRNVPDRAEAGWWGELGALAVVALVLWLAWRGG